MTDDGRTALYRLFDEEGRLLYVGVTSNPSKRWSFHKRKKAWWPLVRIREIEWYLSRTEALTMEAQEIATKRPLHNADRGWQYLLRPEVVVSSSGFVPPTRGTTKLPVPSRRDLQELEQAVQTVQEQRSSGSSAAPHVELPARDERIETRRAFGLAQEKISSVFGVTTLRFSWWELGHKEPSGWDRLAYVRALEAMARVVERRMASDS
ncbi:GIY-YIG nuclease family protein [Streptomyces sp. BR123]|uniref:GIY-YIG nuclease family protein n=1 Tax=Streptomyces sp. BR123 TaxID=2749828 RepID=UPI0015C432DA|nr:GIY-YIG nuclease family protein [Streptomyces sp. BR123]NXY94470.1 GIY-YIG nuclease family protein [Streptomyces sp. BR123]